VQASAAPDPALATASVEAPPESAPALEGAASFEDASTEPFCAQRGSRIFHRRECAWVRRIPEMDRLYFKALADARDQGLQTCPVCEPWEPA
jgi:hypothetical protein